jgi:class 3 adenylate cyclase
MAKLIVRLADGTLQEHELAGSDVHIGRDPSCEIHVPSPYVSRRHARVHQLNGSFVIEDERSTNGLQINGRTVTEPYRLYSGDRVVIGDVTITYEDEDESLRTAVYSSSPVARQETSPAGGAMHTQRPTGLCTLLFTDLVAHTSVVTRLGDLAGQQWLRRHTTLLREQFGPHGGVEEKWTGDGFVVSFDSARRALECAIAILRSLDEYNQQTRDAAIHVRLGLNTGEVLREDDELFGNAVILAARVMAEAGADQILISELMNRLIQSTGEFRTIDRGPFTLKGFAEPQRLFEVQWREAS